MLRLRAGGHEVAVEGAADGLAVQQIHHHLNLQTGDYACVVAQGEHEAIPADAFLHDVGGGDGAVARLLRQRRGHGEEVRQKWIDIRGYRMI